MQMPGGCMLRISFFIATALLSVSSLFAQADRGAGIRTSMVETYVAPHQLLVYPFVAYTWDHNFEYQPASFGYRLNEDLLGHYRSREAQLFVAYGIADWLAVEVEASHINARFDRSPSDTSGMPARTTESGVADVAGQVRFRLAREHGSRPEVFGSLEVLPPQHGNKALIGDAQWAVKSEIGVVRGLSWGTMTFRTTVEYNRGDTHWDLGETSLEYLRQVSPAWRLLFAIEGGEGGAPDDWVLVSAGHWRIAPGLYLKFASGIGLFPKSTDWESQIGILFATH